MRVKEVSEWISEFMYTHSDRLLLPGAVDLISGHRIRGHTLILITGAPGILVEKLKIRKFFDIVYATRLETYDHSYSGRIDGPHYYGTVKAELVKKLSGELNAAMESSYCYADSHEDIAMMSLFGHPVAVRPDRELQRVAEKSHWKIIPA
jgi:HAD superfamily hydrolase (TIGR01490 family)